MTGLPKVSSVASKQMLRQYFDMPLQSTCFRFHQSNWTALLSFSCLLTTSEVDQITSVIPTHVYWLCSDTSSFRSDSLCIIRLACSNTSVQMKTLELFLWQEVAGEGANLFSWNILLRLTHGRAHGCGHVWCLSPLIASNSALSHCTASPLCNSISYGLNRYRIC